MCVNFRQIKKAILPIAVAVGFCLWIPSVVAEEDINQKILDLRQQIEELTKKAEEYKGTVAQKQKEAETLSRQIQILNSQILRLETQIRITEKEIDSAGFQIVQLQGQIFDIQEEIEKRKKAIGEVIVFMYERERTNLLALLLKNPRLSGFVNEMEQAENLNSKLLSLAVELREKRADLKTRLDELEQKKSELASLNQKQQNQKAYLGGSKNTKDDLLARTKGQESEYRRLLDEAERKKAEFFAELRDLENKALETGAFIVHVKASAIPPKGSKILRWPYDDFIITQGYGYTTYARKGAYGGAPHNGVDIAAGLGSPVRPVAGGQILASGINDGWGNWTAVRHENNLVSLYAHMKNPSGLANGTPVSVDDIIGYEGSTGNSTGSHLHLSLYHDFFTYINDKNGQLYFNYFDGTLNPMNYL